MAPLILFVENEALISDVMGEALEEAGFEIEKVTSAEAATELLDADHERFAIVVTDIGLAGRQTGWDIARHARELNHDMPIVYTTGGHAGEWPVHGVPKSMLVTKPYAAAQIVTAMTSVIVWLRTEFCRQTYGLHRALDRAANRTSRAVRAGQ